MAKNITEKTIVSIKLQFSHFVCYMWLLMQLGVSHLFKFMYWKKWQSYPSLKMMGRNKQMKKNSW